MLKKLAFFILGIGINEMIDIQKGLYMLCKKYDEEEGKGRYPKDLLRTLKIASNCTKEKMYTLGHECFSMEPWNESDKVS